jgi:hypothetical protein
MRRSRTIDLAAALLALLAAGWWFVFRRHGLGWKLEEIRPSSAR